MDLDYLFNKNDALTLAVIRQLNTNATNTITKNTLIAEYNLTAYQQNRLFDAINAAFQAVGGEPPCYLEETTKDLWRAHHLTTYCVQQVTLWLLEQSAAFKVLNYYCFESNAQTTAAYAKNHYLTEAVFFRQTKVLKAKFGEDLGRANTKFSEFELRQWLFGLYYTVYTGIATPFPALADQVAPYLKACIHIIGHSLLPTQRVKLTTFIKVWLLRRRNGDNLPATPRHYTAGGYDALSAALETAGESPVPTAECDYLYQFLVTQHYLELPAAQLPTLFPLADDLTRQFIAQLAQSNVATLTEPILRDLTSRLMQIHLRFTTFYLEPTTFIAADQVSFFANLYPEFEAVITRFLNGLKARPEFNLSENMLTNLYFSDMFALINTIPSTALTQVIQICVDFSAGALYSDYVMRSLAAFGHANIRVTQNLDANTDIYIADFHADDLTIPQVIWQNPPTPHDWSQLAALILDCTQQKGGRA